MAYSVTDILITGAAGRAGTALLDHLDGYVLTPLDKEPIPEEDAIVADVTDFQALAKAFADYDAIVHLAADPRTDASWNSIIQNNIIGTRICLEAASAAEVETVVFASSNHVVGMYEQEHAPAIYEPTYDLVLDHKVAVRPDSAYGTSKVFGEAIGRQYVETRAWPRHFYALRMGSLRSPEYDHPFGDAERGVATNNWERNSSEYNHAVKRMTATWLSRRDFAHLVDLCLKNANVEFDVFYGVSDNASRWFDLEHARLKLGYRPSDRAERFDNPPD